MDNEIIGRLTGYGEVQKILKKEGYYISVVDTSGLPLGLRGDNREETAVVVENEDEAIGEKYFILNGDHMEAYKNCSNLEECMTYFRTHEDVKSSWSN